MDRRRFCQALADQRAYCGGRSPLYAEVLAALEADALQAPAWLDAVENAWRERRFAIAWEAAHLLLACLHFWALRGASRELAAVYPSCGGRGSNPGPAARAFLRDAPADFWEQLRIGLVQTNEVGRSVAWMLAAAAAFGPRRLPFHLVELGASAGLNLVGDHLPQACRLVCSEGRPVAAPAGWNRPHAVLTRTGLDLCPRRLADPEDRLWLKACIWADDLPRLERFERATEVFLRLQAEPAGPALERCAFADAPDWLVSNRHPQTGEGLLVFNAIATIYLDESDYRALQQGMVRALAPWGDRALWVEYERARGAAHGPLDLTVHRVMDGRLQSRTLASGAPHPYEMHFHHHWGSMERGVLA